MTQATINVYQHTISDFRRKPVDSSYLRSTGITHIEGDLH
jgi:hypothetical protein